MSTPVPTTSLSAPANGSQHGKISQVLRCQCPPPPAGKTARNLVICLDGAADQFREKNTNIAELYSRLEKNDQQVTYYHYNGGVAMRARSWNPFSTLKQAVAHTLEMVLAWDFKRVALNAYQWLAENYQTGDRIFLFGFSRGAYQARVIAGMIEKVGLLRKGDPDQFDSAYELYAAAKSEGDNARSGSKSSSNRPNVLCAHFKQMLSHPDARVHFVGAWDTVASVGIVKGPSLPETTTGMRHVCVFRHGLALDERRCKFLPEFVNGGNGPSKTASGNVKEVWFVGTHADVGGGNVPDILGPAMHWMTSEALAHGLRMQPVSGWQSFPPHPSLGWIWKIIEVLPVRRLSYRDAASTTRRLNLGRPRVMKEGQLVHESVFKAIAEERYMPPARLPSGLSWSIDSLAAHNMVERDV
ncbi:hypothetical protein FA95DRAFT_1601311 [Auriscalpium vulgare]|uniref:Uncharacterized protein n=1 Tax=Auriscalpium vulgare TaxID=40419 RepID=A0ACB8SAV6_9AGAM|nr:hypothetical protein FA95DRAFT_1601311 [Auriscalpium vulgare]